MNFVFLVMFQMIIAEIDHDKFRQTFKDVDSTSKLHEAENIYAIETSPVDRIATLTDHGSVAMDHGLVAMDHGSVLSSPETSSSVGAEDAHLFQFSAEGPEILILAINRIVEDVRTRRYLKKHCHTYIINCFCLHVDISGIDIVKCVYESIP